VREDANVNGNNRDEDDVLEEDGEEAWVRWFVIINTFFIIAYNVVSKTNDSLYW
jgi:hypothetical protein